jgi:transcriptional regulator with XRE-family HTH domain
VALAGRLLVAARSDRGVSTRALAGLVGASQPGIVDVERGRKDATVERLEGLLAALGYQLTALPTRRPPAALAAGEIRGYLDRGDEAGALRVIWQLAADLQATEEAVRVALCVTPPGPTGDAGFDALLAAVVDHALAADDLPRPGWLDDPWRTLDEPWDVEPVPVLRQRARAGTPAPIAAHGIYLDAAELIDV